MRDAQVSTCKVLTHLDRQMRDSAALSRQSGQGVPQTPGLRVRKPTFRKSETTLNLFRNNCPPHPLIQG